VSFRDTDSILRIKRTDGQVDWKLGGTSTAKSLRVVGDKAVGGPVGGQHDVRIQPDGTLSVADNRTGLKGLPRVARWKIDTVHRAASLVEQLTDSAVRGSGCCGSARRFSDGSWLVAWGGTAHVRAYDKRHRNTFALTFAPGRFPYRASPFAPGQGTRSQFVAGMDRMNPRP